MGTKRILLTDGAGFIGTNLVNELKKRGHEVIAADLYNTERENYIGTDDKSFSQLERVFEKKTLKGADKIFVINKGLEERSLRLIDIW